MHGFVVVDAETGAQLRRGSTALSGALVLESSGGFRAGDRIHVVVRGRDGGQGVLACGLACCDALALLRAGTPHGSGNSVGVQADTADAEQAVTDIVLLWPRSP